VTTKAECVQRLEESRRIRLAYLDTWPDQPHLDVQREVSERFLEKFGPMNAVSSFLSGLKHELDITTDSGSRSTGTRSRRSGLKSVWDSGLV